MAFPTYTGNPYAQALGSTAQEAYQRDLAQRQRYMQDQMAREYAIHAEMARAEPAAGKKVTPTFNKKKLLLLP